MQKIQGVATRKPGKMVCLSSEPSVGFGIKE